KEATPIAPNETAGEVESRLSLIGARLAIDVIDQLAAGPVTGEVQDPGKVTKAPKLTKEIGVIDWNRPAIEIERQGGALQPWPTAYTFLHRTGQSPQRLIILRSGVSSNASGTPGAARASNDGQAIEVTTGENVLRVLELQSAGKKRMLARDFVNGRLF